jgi:hypothetical protein
VSTAVVDLICEENKMKDQNFTVDIVDITPQIANNFLQKNAKNRKISPRHVEAIAKDMESGNWKFNGDAIRFSSNGNLVDGQHRLEGCVLSGKSFKSIVIRNIDDSAMRTIDSGKRRTYGDHLRIRGYENASAIGTTISFLIMIAAQTPKLQGSKHIFTTADYDAVLEKHKDVIESVALAKSTFHRSDALLAAIHYVATYTGYGDQADSFLQSWRDGQINYDDDPVIYIRNLLLKELTKVNKMKVEHKNRLIMLSWQKFQKFDIIKNARLSSVKFYMDGWDEDVCGIS